MKKIFWALILIFAVAICIGSVVFLLHDNGQEQDATKSSARLVPDTLRQDSPTPPAREVTTSKITEASEFVENKQKEETPASVQQKQEPVIQTQNAELPEVIDAVKPQSLKTESVSHTVQDKPAISVLPFKIMGSLPSMESDAGDILCDKMLSEIDSQKYEIYERLQLKNLIEERGFQTSSLSDTSAAVRMGKLAGVRYVVLGSLAKLGGQYSLSARVVDCVDGRIGKRGSTEFSSFNQWSSKIPELVNLLGLRAGSGSDITNQQVSASEPAIQNDLISSVNAGADFSVRIRTAENKQTYYEGEYINFVVQTDKDCFITLITVDPEGKMTLLLPNSYQKRAFAGKGQTIEIPSKESGFRFPILPPHGETIVKAIATLEPLRLNEVTSESISGEKGFVELSPGVKAIGIEAAQPTSGQELKADGLNKLLEPTEWATDELIIITAKSKSDNQQTNAVDSKADSVQFDMQPVGTHVNDKILADYKLLTSKTLSGSALTLVRPASFDMTAVKEYLVFDNSSRVVERFGPSNLSQAKTGDGRVVVPNLKVRSYGLPPTKLVGVQWALKNKYVPGKDLGWDKVYDDTLKKNLPLIGLVDCAVDWQDPRIAHAAWTNTKEIQDNGIDDDNNGYIDDVHGYNFVTDSGNLCPEPYKFNHGTALVSIMAARPVGGDTDVVGLVPNAKIITAVVMSSLPQGDPWLAEGDLEKIIKGIKYVVDNGAKIVNISFGSPVTREQLTQLNKLSIWDQLEQNNIMLICAAGNDNISIDENPVFPACLPRKNVIAVMATDASGQPGTCWNPSDKKWRQFTNFGDSTIDESAPGTLILAATQRGQTDLLFGTSFAAAIVTGSCALIRMQ